MPLRVPSSMIATIGFRQRAWIRSRSPFRKIMVMSGAPPMKVSAASGRRAAPAAAEIEHQRVGLGERAGDGFLDGRLHVALGVGPDAEIADAVAVALDDLGARRGRLDQRLRRLQPLDRHGQRDAGRRRAFAAEGQDGRGGRAAANRLRCR